ncbi:haloacid dehalogenase type II [Microbulbifer yueqingensis]|uniref:(S)-2-haloacid dehalogenase n=1 Tax=Microbulbifer yueqingensis TaxID=658219 RepID=A0A1G9AEA4_9GAMM|nr:2-haloacid dehalogenase [Microbulbifer yueqingensis]
MTSRVVFFDVIETLFSLAPLRERFTALGLPEQAAAVFFAQLLRDAFALSAAGSFRPFPEIARATLEVVLASADAQTGKDEIDTVLEQFGKLPAHPDVRPALERARAGGLRSFLLTNGSRQNTESLVQQAGLESLVEGIISIEEFRVWKPRRELYRQAAGRAGTSPAEATLVAAHAWDTNGALEAGLQAIWVRRQDAIYHPLMREPRACVDDLQEAVRVALEAG